MNSPMFPSETSPNAYDATTCLNSNADFCSWIAWKFPSRSVAMRYSSIIRLESALVPVDERIRCDDLLEFQRGLLLLDCLEVPFALGRDAKLAHLHDGIGLGAHREVMGDGLSGVYQDGCLRRIQSRVGYDNAGLSGGHT